MNQRFFTLFLSVLISTACQTQNLSTNKNQTSNPAATNSANLMTKDANVSLRNPGNAAQTINFDAPDGVRIVGTFYGANAANSPAVLMLHQYGGNRESYKDVAQQFQENGINVLAIDGRGFGESTKKADGSKVSPSQSDESVAGMKSDVAAAVRFLSEQKNVDRQRIGIVGASYGSSLAIIHAGDDAGIKAVALLSPGANYFGNLPIMPSIEKYGARPVLIVAAEDDEESAADSRLLDERAAGDNHQLQIYKEGGHGTGIFAAGVGLENLLLDFFRRNL